MHRSGGFWTAISALHSCSQRSFLALSDGSILGIPVTKQRVTYSEIFRILSYLQKRSTILDVYHYNLLGSRNSTIANEEQTRSVTLAPIINSFSYKTLKETQTELYASRITVTSSLKNLSSGLLLDFTYPRGFVPVEEIVYGTYLEWIRQVCCGTVLCCANRCVSYSTTRERELSISSRVW